MVGITPAASLALVTEASCILSVLTALSASFVVFTTPVFRVGLGYVPVRSPPAAPVGLPPLPTLSADGIHWVPSYFRTWPVAGTVVLMVMPFILSNVGLG